MLRLLQVKDYALIEAVEVEFNNGLNIITGETGAGKSILIDAMNLLLGERASTEVVRKGSTKAVVEGIFEVESNKKVKEILEQNEIDFLPELIVRREISLKGSNRCFLNDTPVSLTLVKTVGNLLVDLHGQHEHQSLLSTETHIGFLDEFGTPDEMIKKYRQFYNDLNSYLSQLNELKKKENILKEKKDFYSFQIKEIDEVSPGEGEEESILAELKILENSEKLLELTDSIYQQIYESEKAVYDSLVEIKKQLDDLTSIDKSFNEADSECQSAIELVKDISGFISNYKSKIDLDPERLEEMRERLSSIIHLKKKYGGSVKAILDHRRKIGEEFDLAENFTASIKELENKITLAREECGKIAAKLTTARKVSAKKIEKEVVDVLKTLGIENGSFKIQIENEESRNDDQFILVNGKASAYNSIGVDRVEFFISTNTGEDPKPLAKVASGGEVSRIMLAIKTILARNDKLPLLIFDEIDTGVSGRVAQKVGNALKSLASFHQIIAITHLPQIAGFADHHYVVEKKAMNGRVTSSIRKLNDEERVKEVAKLMSGENITEASISGAKELMGIK